jgi:hypothetical protein
MDAKKPAANFWVISVLALLWNLAGSLNFMMQMRADSLASMPEPFHTIVANRPGWATAAFAVGVIAGAIGCVLLLLKRSASIYLFAASLLGLAIHLIPYLSPANLPAQLGISNAILIFVAPLIVAIFQILYARHAQRRAWTS